MEGWNGCPQGETLPKSQLYNCDEQKSLQFGGKVKN